MAALKEYKLGAFTYKLTEEEAKRLGATPVGSSEKAKAAPAVSPKSAPAPKNKAVKPAVKSGENADDAPAVSG